MNDWNSIFSLIFNSFNDELLVQAEITRQDKERVVYRYFLIFFGMAVPISTANIMLLAADLSTQIASQNTDKSFE